MRILLQFIIFLTPFQFYIPISTNVYISLVFVAILVSCFYSSIGINREILLHPISVSTLLFGATMLLSVITSNDHMVGIKYLCKWLPMMAAIYIPCTLKLTDIQTAKLLNTLFISALLVSLIAITEYFVGYGAIFKFAANNPLSHLIINHNYFTQLAATDSLNWSHDTTHGRMVRAFGTFNGTLEFTQYLGLIIPVLPIIVAGHRNRLPGYLGGCIIAIALMFTFTRSAYICAISVCLLYLFTYVHNIKKYVSLILSLFFLFLIVCASPSFRSTLDSRIDGFSVRSFDRAALWKAGIKVFTHRPITGVGLENYSNGVKIFVPEWDGKIMPAHNQFIQVAAEMGAVGLFAYLAMLLAVLKSVLSLLRNGESRLMGTAMLGVFVWYVFQSVFISGLFSDKYTFMLFLMFGIIMRQTQMTERVTGL